MKVLFQTMFLLMNKNIKCTARDLPALTEHKQLENVATVYICTLWRVSLNNPPIYQLFQSNLTHLTCIKGKIVVYQPLL